MPKVRRVQDMVAWLMAKALDSGSCVGVQAVAGVILLKCVVGQNTHSITLRATLTHMYK